MQDLGYRIETVANVSEVSVSGYLQHLAFRTFTFGSAIEDQQLSCLWLKDALLSVNLAGFVHYLNTSQPSQPTRIIKGHNKPITALTMSVDKQFIFTGDFEGNISKCVCAWAYRMKCVQLVGMRRVANRNASHRQFTNRKYPDSLSRLRAHSCRLHGMTRLHSPRIFSMHRLVSVYTIRVTVAGSIQMLIP